MIIMENELRQIPKLQDKILHITKRPFTMNAIASLLTRCDDKLEWERVEYTILNMEEDGWLVYNSSTDRYTVNEDRYDPDGEEYEDEEI